MAESSGYYLTLFSTPISIILKVKKCFIYFELDAHAALTFLLEGKLVFPVIIPSYIITFAFIDFC